MAQQTTETPKMTRKDFKFIAETIDLMGLKHELTGFIATEFADRLASTNPKFNRAAFLKECGL